MHDARELHACAGMAHYLWREVFVIVSGPYERFDNTATMSLLRELKSEGRKFAVVTLVEPDSPALDETSRAAIKRSLGEMGDSVACAITQVVGEGLAVSIALAIASGMMMVGYRAGAVAWPSALTRAPADTAARLVKLAPACVGNADATTVVRALEDIRRRARAHFDGAGVMREIA